MPVLTADTLAARAGRDSVASAQRRLDPGPGPPPARSALPTDDDARSWARRLPSLAPEDAPAARCRIAKVLADKPKAQKQRRCGQ
ncbi:MAG: hypothetical protein WKG07_22200 [Hymenobacter sp.]